MKPGSWERKLNLRFRDPDKALYRRIVGLTYREGQSLNTIIITALRGILTERSRGACVLLTGLPGPERLSIAQAMERRLSSVAVISEEHIAEQLGVTAAGGGRFDHLLNVRLATFAARHVVNLGGVAVMSLMIPYELDRVETAKWFSVPFILVHVENHRPLTRTAPYYETPNNADLVIPGGTSASEAAERICGLVEKATEERVLELEEIS